MIYLYRFVEPLTSRELLLPISVDSSGKCRVVSQSFSENILSELRKGNENDCTHYKIDYTKPNSSIQANWVSAGGTYDWSYDGFRYHLEIGPGDILMESVATSGWFPGTVNRSHYVFVQVNGDGSLHTTVFTSYYRPQDDYRSETTDVWDVYTLFGRWPGYQGTMFQSYWPSTYSAPLPEFTLEEKASIINSVTRELDDRLGQTPPPSEVFRNAAGSIGNNMNSIANLVEGVDFVNDLLSFNVTDLIKDMKDWSPKKIKKALSSGWMGYRYSYSTTKADIEGMTDYLLSYVDPNNFTNLKRYASESNEYGTTRCKIVFSSGDPINNTLRQLETTGMMLNAYAVWDMVPLSFVVDWFLPIGDFLEDLSGNWVSQPSVFNFSEIMFSRKTRIDDVTRGIHAKAYKRWVADRPPAFEVYSSSPSSKTVVKRVFDGLALTIGG